MDQASNFAEALQLLEQLCEVEQRHFRMKILLMKILLPHHMLNMHVPT